MTPQSLGGRGRANVLRHQRADVLRAGAVAGPQDADAGDEGVRLQDAVLPTGDGGAGQEVEADLHRHVAGNDVGRVHRDGRRAEARAAVAGGTGRVVVLGLTRVWI